MTEYQEFSLNNGLRLVHLNASSPVAHCGIFINAGSRDEKKQEHGMAHFIEHVLFKGTNKRKAYHIISGIEDVGGELDAYTTKEKTVIYATFLNQHYGKVLDILSDIVFNSNFPKKELEKEKEVIIDEINSYLDNPSEQIFDDFEQQLFNSHALGRPILGTPESIKKFTETDIRTFLKNNYNTNRIIVCSVGNIDFEKLKNLFIKYFSHIPVNISNYKRKKFSDYKPFELTQNKNTHQAHCIIGNVAYNISDNNRIGLILLNNILGGNNMNSRLNMLLREKYGLVYNVETSYHYYFDTGLFYIYFGTDKEDLEKSIQLTKKELKKLRNEKLGINQLQKAKNQLTGQIAISADSNVNLMFTIGKSYLLYNKVDDLSKVYKKIDAITSEDLLKIANEILEEKQLSTLIYL